MRYIDPLFARNLRKTNFMSPKKTPPKSLGFLGVSHTMTIFCVHIIRYTTIKAIIHAAHIVGFIITNTITNEQIRIFRVSAISI